MIAPGKELDVRFRSAAEAFRLIDDKDTAPVVVRYYGEAGNDRRVDELLALIERDGPQRWLFRQLQPTWSRSIAGMSRACFRREGLTRWRQDCSFKPATASTTRCSVSTPRMAWALTPP